MQGGPRPPGLPVNREEESTFYLPHLEEFTFCQRRQLPHLEEFTFFYRRPRSPRDGLSPFSLLLPPRRRSQGMPMAVSAPRPAHRRTRPRPIPCGPMLPCESHLFPHAPSLHLPFSCAGLEDDDLLKHAPAKIRGLFSSIPSSATPSCAGGAAAAPPACPPPPPLRFSLRKAKLPAPPAFSSQVSENLTDYVEVTTSC